MRNKIFSIIVFIFLVIVVFSPNIFAGSAENPEITDNEDDCFGSFIIHPFRYRMFHSLGLLEMENFDFLDIKSAWFHEDPNYPEYLFASISLKDLDVVSQRAVYSVHWKFNNVRYAVGSHIYNNGLNISCSVGLDRHFSIFSKFKAAESHYDFENDIITFKLKKEYVGDLKEGDILSDTWAWTALRFNNEPMTIVFSNGELVKDAAPFLEGSNDYGLDYIIKY